MKTSNVRLTTPPKKTHREKISGANGSYLKGYLAYRKTVAIKILKEGGIFFLGEIQVVKNLIKLTLV